MVALTRNIHITEWTPTVTSTPALAAAHVICTMLSMNRSQPQKRTSGVFFPSMTLMIDENAV